jgi:hypothetical protein
MPDLATGSIRTVTTLVIGAFLTAGVGWLRRETGVELPSDPLTINALSAAVYAFVTALWYVTFASLERRWPPFGVFLGWPKAPHYDVGQEDVEASRTPEKPQASGPPSGNELA